MIAGLRLALGDYILYNVVTLEVDPKMQTEIGIRELKAQLSSYLRRVRAGETIIITDRGQPIGRIVPISASTSDQLQVLRSAGLIDWNGETLARISPVAQITGLHTVADIVLENRE